jgi:hypothetical protein
MLLKNTNGDFKCILEQLEAFYIRRVETMKHIEEMNALIE